MRRAVVACVVVTVVLGAVGGGAWATRHRLSGPSPSRAATDRPCRRAYVSPPVRRAEPALTVARVATLDGPSALAFEPPGALAAGGAGAGEAAGVSDAVGAGDAVGVVGERGGRIFVLRGDDVEGEPVIDLSKDTGAEGDGGLLGLAYAPDGNWLYAYRTDAGRDEVVTAYPVRDHRPDAAGEQTILEIDHPPSDQHHGGGFAFGPDGLLYVGTGDGGGLGDPRGNAQSRATLLGKVLRIDPTPAAASPYRVPSGNPFVGQAGARPEIYALGLRNPFRLSFDQGSGDLWIGDVGQSCWEELDRLERGGTGGENLGWDHREGSHPFEGGGPGGFVDPVHTMAHRDGWCAVVAGFAYRGEARRDLDGAFLFTDFCKGDVLAWRDEPGAAPALVDLDLEVDSPVALVPGPGGEPWLLSLDGDVYRAEPPAPP